MTETISPANTFTTKFWTPYDQYKAHVGKSFEVLSEVDPSTYDADECGPMWNIRLEDGVEIQALPEEICTTDVNYVRGMYPTLNPM